MKTKHLLMINASLIIMITTISKGLQITIPAEFRNDLGLTVGSRVEIKKKGKKLILEPIGEEMSDLLEEAKHVKPKIKMNSKQMDELNERLANEIHR